MESQKKQKLAVIVSKTMIVPKITGEEISTESKEKESQPYKITRSQESSSYIPPKRPSQPFYAPFVKRDRREMYHPGRKAYNGRISDNRPM